MKKLFILSFYLLHVYFCVNANDLFQNSDCNSLPLSSNQLNMFTGHLELSSGCLFGAAQEYVSKDAKTISRLDWQEMLVPFVFVSGNISFYNFFLNADILFAIPPVNGSGSMEDYDFLLDGTDQPSQYSQHTVFLDKHTDASVKLGYTFIFNNFKLSPAAGFLYRSRKWSAVDGYLQYPEDDAVWTGDEPRQIVSGTIINYEQLFWIPFFSLEFAYRLQLFKFQLTGRIYPYLWARSLDSHFLRLVQFYDTMEGGIGGFMELSVLRFFPATTNKNFALKLALGYDVIRDVTGSTAQGIIGKTDSPLVISSRYGSKTQSDVWSLSLGIIFTGM